MTHSEPEYTFSYEVTADQHPFWEEPTHSESEFVPVSIFSHASTMQALARYLVDTKGHSFTNAARLLGRSPKSIWASYHQTARLPETREQATVPVSIFSAGLTPLEALVRHLRETGMRNVDIARRLKLSPKTTHTAWKRAEVKR